MLEQKARAPGWTGNENRERRGAGWKDGEEQGGAREVRRRDRILDGYWMLHVLEQSEATRPTFKTTGKWNILENQAENWHTSISLSRFTYFGFKIYFFI